MIAAPGSVMSDDLRKQGGEYKKIADELRTMATDLDNCIAELKDSGWTTPAGSAFHDMVTTNWKDNIEKYASMLDTLQEILDNAATQYDGLVTNHIELTKL